MSLVRRGRALGTGGDYFTIEAAREYAAKIIATCDEVTPAHPDALRTLDRLAKVTGSTAEKVAGDLGIDLQAATVADVDRAAMALGAGINVTDLRKAAHGEAMA
ncbi:hypothetical protein [Nocardioides pocheonensis]|uniref:hypothetical protein n=1 Tax=Nocardioides pocheonensis TaxID=661485 RepID=UPI0011CE8250|nr:hypothetical protein [Nocardioides pocheonensis]